MADAICYNCYYGRNVPPDHKIEETQQTFCYYTGQTGNKDPDFTCQYWKYDPYLDGQGQKIFPYRSIASKFMGRGMTDPWAAGLGLCYPYRSSVGLAMRTRDHNDALHKCYPYRRKTAGPDPNWGGLEFRMRTNSYHWPPQPPGDEVPEDEDNFDEDRNNCDGCPAQTQIGKVTKVKIKNLQGTVGTWCHPDAVYVCEYYNLASLNRDWWVPMVCDGANNNALALTKPIFLRGKDCCNWVEGACGNPTVYWGIGSAYLYFLHGFDDVGHWITFTQVKLLIGGSVYGAPMGYGPSSLEITYAPAAYGFCAIPETLTFEPTGSNFITAGAPPYSELDLKNLGSLELSWPWMVPDWDDCYKAWNPTVPVALPFFLPS